MRCGQTAGGSEDSFRRPWGSMDRLAALEVDPELTAEALDEAGWCRARPSPGGPRVTVNQTDHCGNVS